MPTSEDFTFPYEKTLRDADTRLHEAQVAWLSAIDSVRHLDRKTHELIRMVCNAGLRNASGVERHARLAAESGASWDEIVSALAITQPTFGILPAIESMPAARSGFDAAGPVESEE